MFLGLRAIRIFPALFVEVMLSALVLGVLFTNVPLTTYFTDHKFFTYLLNITGHIHYELPGVFTNNPNPVRVNGQLWTVPFELYCYIALFLIAFLGIYRYRIILPFVITGLLAAWAVFFFTKHGFSGNRAPTGVPGHLLIIYFLTGVAMARFGDLIKWDGRLFSTAVILSLTFLSFPIYGDILAIMPVTYVVIYLGLCNPTKVMILKGADYSYGIFLYGYAIQQAWMAVHPSLHEWYWNIILALPTTTLMAMFSWHFIEKPALSSRKYLTALEEKWFKLKAWFLRGDAT